MLKVTSRRPKSKIKEKPATKSQHKYPYNRIKQDENIYQLCHYFEKQHSTVNRFTLAQTQCTTRNIKNFLNATITCRINAQAHCSSFQSQQLDGSVCWSHSRFGYYLYLQCKFYTQRFIWISVLSFMLAHSVSLSLFLFWCVNVFFSFRN